MILQPSTCNSCRIWILSSLLPTPEVSTPTNIRTSRRRLQLNKTVAELKLLGSTPVPLRSCKLPKWFSCCRALLSPACGEDVAPIFSNQIRGLLNALAALVGDRDILTHESVAEIMLVALGSAPTPGHVDVLSTCPQLLGVIGRYSVTLKSNKLTSWADIKSRLLTAIPPEQCEHMLNGSRSALLVKIVDLMGYAIESLQGALLSMHEWFLVDLECFLGTTTNLEDRAAFVGDFLEVLACFHMPPDAQESYFSRLCTSAFICLEQVHRRTWRSSNSMAGWLGVVIAMNANEIQPPIVFKPDTPIHVRHFLRTILERGLQFGQDISIDRNEGVHLPPVPANLPEPGPFLVENGLLLLLTGFEWLNPDGCLQNTASLSTIVPTLAPLVKRANKEYQKATRLVNTTLKLVTELAAEEGIQLSEEERARLLEDIANSDRRGVMSRAWENSPVKGSVPPMIVQLIGQSWHGSDAMIQADPVADFVRASVKAYPYRPSTLALLFLGGEAILGRLRSLSRDASADGIDYDAAAGRMETGLAQLVHRLPIDERFPCKIDRMLLGALRSTRPPSTLYADDALIGLYETVAPELGLKTSLPLKTCTLPTPIEFSPPPAPVKRPSKRRVVHPHATRRVESDSSSSPQRACASITPTLTPSSPTLTPSSPALTPSSPALTPSSLQSMRIRTSFQIASERPPLTVGTLCVRAQGAG